MYPEKEDKIYIILQKLTIAVKFYIKSFKVFCIIKVEIFLNYLNFILEFLLCNKLFYSILKIRMAMITIIIFTICTNKHKCQCNTCNNFVKRDEMQMQEALPNVMCKYIKTKMQVQ